MSISLRFLGAARHVTGSKHLLCVNDRRVLFECGMVQGPRAMANKANRELPFDPTEIDAVVLSHAHIDHSGSLPRLVKEGYEGPIWCTPATADLLAIMLPDSAHIQAADARYLREHDQEFEPAYDEQDVKRTLRQLRTVDYHQRFDVSPEIAVEYLDAGHILGSAQEVIDVDDGGRRTRIGFTGDLGRPGAPILRDPDPLPDDCDVLITESTYGDRLHPEARDLEEALAEVVEEEVRDGGRILIPAFSVGRTQHVVMFLGNLMASGRIPKVPIWVDTPLGTAATKILARYPDLFDRETREILAAGRRPFFFDGVRYVADVEESMSLNSVRQGIIIAASGMCEAGRILHHLKFSVDRREDCVLMVGFQAQGTLGRKLLDGHEYVRIFGSRYRVRCKVRSLGGFSAHADWKELLAATRHLAAHAGRAFVVHGEEQPALTHVDRLRDAGFRDVHAPTTGQEIELA